MVTQVPDKQEGIWAIITNGAKRKAVGTKKNLAWGVRKTIRALNPVGDKGVK